jgi:hypothetical protein
MIEGEISMSLCLLSPTLYLPVGWGVYASEDVCCSPNVAFPDGCSVLPEITAMNSTANVSMYQDTLNTVMSTQGP